MIKNKINLGCGKNIKKGWVNLDKIKLRGVDKIQDLDKFPYPFKDNSVEEIFMNHVLEHLEDVIKVMEELYRICKNGAIIEINVPHFAHYGAYKDLTHKHFFSYYSFDYFTSKNDFNFYTPCRFKIIKRRIIYPRGLFLLEQFINLFPKMHEDILRKFLPVRSLSFILEVKKI